MNKDSLYELAFAFRDTKLWKKLAEEELFAVKYAANGTGDNIAYCFVMGANGEHTALAVYPGDQAFSTYRDFTEVLTSEHVEPQDFLIQDCIHCSFEQKDMFHPDDLAEVKAYCKKTDRPFRVPLPQFTRYNPFCVPWMLEDAADWGATEAALRVVLKLTAEIKRAGKKQLGLRPVLVSVNGEAYDSEQLDLFTEPASDAVTIPLYSIVNDELVTERIPLPPYEKRRIPQPQRIDAKTLEKLKRKKQKGVYQCELLRLPEPIDGEPSYFPVMLLAVDETGYMLPPNLSDAPELDPDAMLRGFLEGLNGAYPKAIKVRTEETKALLEDFCRDANILLAMTDDLKLLDEGIDYLLDQMLDYDDEDDYDDDDDDDGFFADDDEDGNADRALFEIDDDEDDDDEDDDDFEAELRAIKETVDMLSGLSVAEMRMMPRLLLDQILEFEALLPPQLVKKLRKARGK